MARRSRQAPPPRRTRPLDTLIRETLAARTDSGARVPALVFVSGAHDRLPEQVLQDTVLAPVDKIVWMVIRQRGHAGAPCAVFPSHEEIVRQANVSSRATVARALAILRATRWLSLCTRVRQGEGHTRGHVYALHDAPLPLADTLHYDPNYLTFLEASREHHHARVRQVAHSMWASIGEDAVAGGDARRAQRTQRPSGSSASAVHDDTPRPYFSYGANVLAKLSNQRTPHPLSNAGPPSGETTARVQNLHVQKLNSPPCSSSYIKTTTTTTNAEVADAATQPKQGALAFPSRLSEPQRALATRYLEPLPAAQHQVLLDELEGRLRAERQGAKPLYDALRYLHQLCTLATRGDFVPNLGLGVRREREARQAESERLRSEARARASERAKRAHTPRGESPLAELRRSLGLPPFARPTPRKKIIPSE